VISAFEWDDRRRRDLGTPPPEEEAMRIPARLATIATCVLLGLLWAAPASAAAVFIEVNPSTVEAGNQIGIRASCKSNGVAATVRSDAFAAAVVVKPQFGFLVATVRIPADTKSMSVTVRLTCPDGSTATTPLHIVGKTRPTRGPATGFGGTAGDDPSRLLIGSGLLTLAAGVGLGVLTLRRRRTALR
jgi:hypothetical protein